MKLVEIVKVGVKREIDNAIGQRRMKKTPKWAEKRAQKIRLKTAADAETRGPEWDAFKKNCEQIVFWPQGRKFSNGHATTTLERDVVKVDEHSSSNGSGSNHNGIPQPSPETVTNINGEISYVHGITETAPFVVHPEETDKSNGNGFRTNDGHQNETSSINSSSSEKPMHTRELFRNFIHSPGETSKFVSTQVIWHANKAIKEHTPHVSKKTVAAAAVGLLGVAATGAFLLGRRRAQR